MGMADKSTKKFAFAILVEPIEYSGTLPDETMCVKSWKKPSRQSLPEHCAIMKTVTLPDDFVPTEDTCFARVIEGHTTRDLPPGTVIVATAGTARGNRVLIESVRCPDGRQDWGPLGTGIRVPILPTGIRVPTPPRGIKKGGSRGNG
jgi:hypothetical protein